MTSIKLFGLVLLMAMFSSTSAQNTENLKVMTYNLLYYRQTSSQCTNTNNNPVTKEQNLRTIVNTTQADIYVFNEVGSRPDAQDSLMKNVFEGQAKSYTKANYSNNGSNLVNALVYDSTKLTLAEQMSIRTNRNGSNLVRVIDFYRFYYRDPNLRADRDTVFFCILAAHLKAGNTSADETERGNAADAVMDFLNRRNRPENYILCGDLNVYSSNEPAIQKFATHPNSTVRLLDPVNQPGNWSNNANFALYHTQSTSTTSGCFSGGGMDDRFDQILANTNVLNGNQGVEYVDESYVAYGQDGLRFNQSITSPANTAVPQGIAIALGRISDHLPVIAEFEIEKINTTAVEYRPRAVVKAFLNNNGILIFKNLENNLISQIEIFNAQGMLVGNSNNLTNLPSGIYLVAAHLSTGEVVKTKVIKLFP